jgi:hypothetical protein
VAGCCEHGDEFPVSGATGLVEGEYVCTHACLS